VTAAVVGLALALLAYTYFGYPLAVGLLARLFPARRAPGDDEAALGGQPAPMVTVCLPVYNGARFLPRKIESLLAQDYPRARLEILVYSDGSSDDTEEVARALAASPEAGGRIRVVVAPDRRGKPAALNALRELATGDLLLLNDVRQPLSPNSVRLLAAALRDPQVGCATGNLVLEGGAASGLYWRYENWIRRQESRFRGVVGMSGSIAMMRRADLEPLPVDLILDDVWIPMRLGLGGRRVVFVEGAEAYDAAFDDEDEFRRKVRTLAGNYQLLAWMPALLAPIKNPCWFEITSHKVLRLLAPWFMLALLAASLRGSLAAGTTGVTSMRVLVAAQLGFYLAASLGRRAGRATGVARTFVVLNAAAVVGLWRFVTGRQRVTW
jgi:biofilm PGA synthesis N-glycosyltransferase PgaC